MIGARPSTRVGSNLPEGRVLLPAGKFQTAAPSTAFRKMRSVASHEADLASPTVPDWNQVMDRLRAMDGLRRALGTQVA